MWNLVRRMGGARGVVEEKWLLRRDRFLLMQPANCLVCHVGREAIALLRRGRWLDRNSILKKTRIVLVVVSGKEAVEVLEAKAGRPPIKRTGGTYLPGGCVMPLTESRGTVAVILQHFRDGCCVLWP